MSFDSRKCINSSGWKLGVSARGGWLLSGHASRAVECSFHSRGIVELLNC